MPVTAGRGLRRILVIFDQMQRDAARNGQYDVVGSVVAYNTPDAQIERIAGCFASSPIRSRMVVIDNSPHPASARICSSLGLDYHRSARNLGFGAAQNLALEASRNASRYHLVMNPDISFNLDTLPELLAFCDANPSIGLVMPRIVFPDGSPQYLCKRLPTPVDIFV